MTFTVSLSCLLAVAAFVGTSCWLPAAVPPGVESMVSLERDAVLG